MSEIKLDMRLKQALRISPQLLQSTQILQMNAQDLREYVDKALEQNPVLDKAPEYEAQREFQELCRQAGWISGQGVRTGSSSGEEPYRPEAGAWDTAMTSLSAFLSDQLGRKALSKPLRELCRYLVQVLDEDGFLEQEDIDAVCALGVPQELVQQAVATLQELEPAGVAARDLPECLLLQLRRMPEDTTLAQRIATSYLPLLGKKRWHALAEKLGVSRQAVFSKRVITRIILAASIGPLLSQNIHPHFLFETPKRKCAVHGGKEKVFVPNLHTGASLGETDSVRTAVQVKNCVLNHGRGAELVRPCTPC